MSRIEEMKERSQAMENDPELTEMYTEDVQYLVTVTKAATDAWNADHIALFGEDYWSLEHPLSCEDMTECFWNGVCRLGPPPQGLGRYGLAVGDAVPIYTPYDGASPRAALRQALSRDRGSES